MLISYICIVSNGNCNQKNILWFAIFDKLLPNFSLAYSLSLLVTYVYVCAVEKEWIYRHSPDLSGNWHKAENKYEIKSLLKQNKRLSKRQEMQTKMSMTSQVSSNCTHLLHTYGNIENWDCFQYDDMSPTHWQSIVDGKCTLRIRPAPFAVSELTAFFDYYTRETR